MLAFLSAPREITAEGILSSSPAVGSGSSRAAGQPQGPYLYAMGFAREPWADDGEESQHADLVRDDPNQRAFYRRWVELMSQGQTGPGTGGSS